MADLEIIADGDELYVDSRLIAERLGIEHESFLRTLDNYQTQIEQGFGILRFEIGKIDGRGRPPRFAYLNEDQATFVMTLSRNSPEVIQCKLDLVSSFSKAKKLLRQRQEQEQTVRQVPYWYQRLRLAMSDAEKPLQSGYFCIYEEMLRFFATLEGRLGYVIPDRDELTGRYLIPDISIGQRFNAFMRDEDEVPCLLRQEFLGSTEPVDFREPRMRKEGWFLGGSHHREILKYNHVYPSVSHGQSNVQSVNSYPVRYLSIFQYFLQEYWISDNCLPYLQKRDPEGVRYLSVSLSELPPSAKQALAGTLLGKLMQALPPAS